MTTLEAPDTAAGIELEVIQVIADVPDKNGNTMLYESDAEAVLEAIKAAGFAIVRDPTRRCNAEEERAVNVLRAGPETDRGGE